MPSHHARSFSNDRATLQPLEPRRPRRGNGSAVNPGWEATTPSPREQDEFSQEDQMLYQDQPVSGAGAGAAHSRLRSGSGTGTGAGLSSSNLHYRDHYHDDPHDAESQRPLTPIVEKPPTSRAGSTGGPVTWMSLPHKDQLFLLFIGRLVDFLQIASMQAYVFYQLKHFDKSLSDAEISQQAGILQGCFTGAQVLTAILWGKAADASWCGRKRVLVIGLGGTALSCIGYGFATTFFWAAFWRAFGGAINGTVGIIRTMVAEITKEKKYFSRAFLILPMSFNVASMVGPIMGGVLADPAVNLPGLFGENAAFGFRWIRDYPYALPSLMNCVFLSAATALTFLFLEEVSPARSLTCIIAHLNCSDQNHSRPQESAWANSMLDYAMVAW